MKTTTLASLVIITALTGLFNSQPIEALTLSSPTQDTWVHQPYDLQHAYDPSAALGRSTENGLCNMLFSFDIPNDANTSFSEAYIELKVYSTRGSSLIDFAIYQNTSPWVEENVTWPTAPQHETTDLLDNIEVSYDRVTWTAASGPLLPEQWVRMSLNETGKAMVRQWIVDPSSNYGVTFAGGESNPSYNYNYFYTSNAGYYPEGDGVEQSAVPEPLSLFMLLSACIALIKRVVL